MLINVILKIERFWLILYVFYSSWTASLCSLHDLWF